jgi:hypothetical protein
MKHLLSPNRWSCVATSFAMVLDVPLETIIQIVKHDGSQKFWENLPEPRCRRGFHIQEMIDLCFLLGALVTPFQARPTSISDGASCLRIPETFWSPKERIERALKHPGVIQGETFEGQQHAMAWDGQRLYDPGGKIVSLEMFQLEVFWLISRF